MLKTWRLDDNGAVEMMEKDLKMVGVKSVLSKFGHLVTNTRQFKTFYTFLQFKSLFIFFSF